MPGSDEFENQSNRRSSQLTQETSTPNMRLSQWAEMKSLSIDTDSIVERDLQRERNRQIKRVKDEQKRNNTVCRGEARGNLTRENSAVTVGTGYHGSSKPPRRGCFGVVLNCFR